MKLALKFAYDGKKYHGYARQPNLKTIEGEIIKKLIENNYIKNINGACLRSASRTDKKVSAFSNVITFSTDGKIENLIKILNKKSDDIIFYGYKNVPSDFNPRHANLRIYRYYLKKNRYLEKKLLKASNVFVGEHDFSNFARVEPHKNPVRSIDDIILTGDKKYFYIDFYAKNFLWNQIRRIMSAIINYSNDKISLEKIVNAIENPNLYCDLGLASPEPLVLKEIKYNFEFKYNKTFLQKIERLEEKILKNIS